MAGFGVYDEWRSSLEGADYVAGIDVEVRTGGGRDRIVGFLGVDSGAPTSEGIGPRAEALWPELGPVFAALEQLDDASSPAYMVFTDEGLSSFRVHGASFAQESRAEYGPRQFAHVIEDMGGVRMTGRTPKPPRYPAALPPYSRWHYGLDWACKCWDLDYIEIRRSEDGEQEFRAFLEVTGNLRTEADIVAATSRAHPQCIFNRLDLQRTILREMSGRFNVPAYLVIHTTDLSCFRVYDLSYDLLLRCNLEEYESWLVSG